MAAVSLTIPSALLPRDGRFGCGPAKIRPEAVAALAGAGTTWLGTSHRQPAVKDVVAAIRSGLAQLYAAPDGYEVALGNGGSTLFWDIATFGLVERRASVGVFGEFSKKFSAALARTPWLDEPAVHRVDPGSVALPQPAPDADAYVWAHNETSTGAAAPVHRIAGAAPEALHLIDATSAAGALPVDLADADAYYFAPQKSFASDGGLWLALLSPAAVERAGRLASARWTPDSLSLHLALENSRANQTLNTPALATLFLMAQQIEWLLANGGLAFAAQRSGASSAHLYAWADAHPLATPFVAEPHRSPVVGTIDFDASVDAAALSATLRANGILDVEPYRSLGRNQLRIGMFPAVDPADVEALTGCIDWVLERS